MNHKTSNGFVTSAYNPLAVFSTFWIHRELILQLAWREIVQRYRGSVFGLLWSLFHPLLMLAVFTFVFGRVLPTRSGLDVIDTPAFGLTLFAGLVVFWLISECLTRAPRLLLENPSFVKRVVFPVEILPWVVVLTAVFHTTVSTIVLLCATWFVQGSLPFSIVMLPFVLAPVAIFGLGALWFFAALGVYIRDIQQMMPIFLTALMFLTPIFYPSSALPDAIRSVLMLNPLAGAIERTRAVVLTGVIPDWQVLLGAFLTSWAIAWLGRAWFERVRWGFAGVI